MDENTATSLKSFEEQLKQQVDPNNSKPVAQQNIKQTQVVKNIVVSFPSDFTGCGNIRNIIPMNFLSNLYGKSGKLICIVAPFYITQQDILARSRALFFQRQMNSQQYQIIKEYKKNQKFLKYKMICDLDDMIFNKNEKQGGLKHLGVPSYNFGYSNINDDVREHSVKIMNLMDVCCFSTKYLADFVKNELKVEPPCVVMPNAIPKFFWGGVKRPDKKERIKKPRVLYTGSPTHYSNQLKMKGDFDNSWHDWIQKAVKNDEITFVCMGGLPWFFENLKNYKNFKYIDWVSSFEYHTYVKKFRADISIGPLVPNDFNHSKSCIKYIEAAASSSAFIGTVFTNGLPSPYDDCYLKVNDNCTIDDIDEIVEKLKEPEYFNKIKNDQFDMLEPGGWWLESPIYIKRWLDLF